MIEQKSDRNLHEEWLNESDVEVNAFWAKALAAIGSTTASEEPKRFYNHAHDSHGRFAKSAGSKSKNVLSDFGDSDPKLSQFKTKVAYIQWMIHTGHADFDIVQKSGLPAGYVKGVAAAYRKKRHELALLRKPIPPPVGPAKEGQVVVTPKAGPTAKPKAVVVEKPKEETLHDLQKQAADAIGPNARTAHRMGADGKVHAETIYDDPNVNFGHGARKIKMDMDVAKEMVDTLRMLQRDFPTGMTSLRGVSIRTPFEKGVPNGTYGQYWSGFKQIALNPTFFSSKQKVAEAIRRDEQILWHPDSNGHQVKSVLVHEFGHHLDYQVMDRIIAIAGMSNDSGRHSHELEQEWAQVKAAINPVSQYARKNDREFVAEAFMAGYLNPGRYPEAAKMVAFMKKLFAKQEWDK